MKFSYPMRCLVAISTGVHSCYASSSRSARCNGREPVSPTCTTAIYMTLEVQGTAPERTSTAQYLQKRSQSYGASSLFNRTLPTLLHQDIF
ncbi:hypothetical protein J2W97_002455 [Paenibacillus jamilae]|uniref:hypothetical protein n=1 Tax=Paenibacillus TaxID=44249 RepID=UPI0011AFA68A|nr:MULTISPECIES: hypothetical protein [Paenibacillus]KAF6635836.1 hypothetical protein HFE01_02805 [Paenibacillus sp. EKM10P]MDP9676460.1 hypothetical protein [Paenibacillus jamilae]